MLYPAEFWQMDSFHFILSKFDNQFYNFTNLNVWRRLDILRLLSMSYGRIGRRKQVKRAKKCLWHIWSMKRKCSHEAKFALQISWRTDSESGYIWTWKFLNPQRKIFGFRNIRIHVQRLSSILLVVVRQATYLPGFAQFFFSNTYPTYPPPRLDSSSPTDLKLTKNFRWLVRSILV